MTRIRLDDARYYQDRHESSWLFSARAGGVPILNPVTLREHL